MTILLIYFLLPFVFCSDDYQLIRIWMKDVSSIGIHGVTDDSLFLSVQLDVPKLMSPDFKYAINDVIEKQPPHKYLKNDDDFRIYGNCHWNQQVFRFFPDTGIILSERFPDMALNVVNEYLQLVDEKSIPSNRKWKIKESAYKSLYELRHSHFKLDYFLIDHFNANSNLTNNTHVTVDDIQPEFINGTENSFTEIKQEKPKNVEIQNMKQKKEKEQPKKKNTTIWIIISVIVIIIIIGTFRKIRCFPGTTNNQRNNIGETSDQNHNN
jgi:hypothetical protein